MSNPLFNLFGGDKLPGPMGNLADMLQQFKQFKESFRGDPKQEVMKLLQSGKISQAQLDQIQMMANHFQQML